MSGGGCNDPAQEYKSQDLDHELDETSNGHGREAIGRW